MDWFKTAGNNGTIRRLCYAYADTSGFADIPVRNCTALNTELSSRLQTMFQIFRDKHPVILKFVFSLDFAANANEVNGEPLNNDVLIEEVTDADLNTMFDGLGNGEGNVQIPKLTLLRDYAKQIANDTFTEADSSIEQLEKNLRSLIGQKAVEFNLLASLVTRTSNQLRQHYTVVFDQNQGKEELEERDITDAFHAVKRSRQIFQAFLEAEEFEENFLRQKPKIPKSFFIKKI